VLKKIVFLIIASILVIGLVLPGCAGGGGGGGGGGGEEFDQWITFAVVGAMNDVTGKHALWGAELARDEINSQVYSGAGGIDVEFTPYGVKLVQVDTNEVNGTPDQGVAALQAVIDDVDFVVGGDQTEKVQVYREVAMDAKKIFMNCGASGATLQYSVVQDYDRYKYWFKTIPINGWFMMASLFKMTEAIGTVLKNALLAEGDAVAEDYRVPEDGKLRLAILVESTAEYANTGLAAQVYLPAYGFTKIGKWLVSPTATDISTELSQIAAQKPHIILTAFSGPVGAVYSKQRVELGIPAMTIGINLRVQVKSAWADTDGKCNGEIYLDAWAEDLQYTPKTTTFFNAFVAKNGEYPFTTAATYDAIYSLKEAIEAVSAAHGWDDITDVVDPAHIDALIQYLETSSYIGTVGTTCYYPMPEVDLVGGVYALSEAQVRTLYDLDSYGKTYVQDDWRVSHTVPSGGPINVGGHIAHDVVYGLDYQTGIGSQWQDGKKVGVWPVDLGDAYDEALTDQYGCWNFAYPGTVDVLIPIEEFLAP